MDSWPLSLLPSPGGTGTIWHGTGKIQLSSSYIIQPWTNQPSNRMGKLVIPDPDRKLQEAELYPHQARRMTYSQARGHRTKHSSSTILCAARGATKLKNWIKGGDGGFWDGVELLSPPKPTRYRRDHGNSILQEPPRYPKHRSLGSSRSPYYGLEAPRALNRP